MRLTNAICSTAATNKIDGESIDAHVRVLRTLAKTCNFCTCLQDSLIRDRIFLAVLEGDTRKRLLRQTLKTEVNSRKSKRPEEEPKDKNSKPTDRKYPNRKHQNGRKPANNKPYEFCGRKHRKGRANCSAWGRTCGSCSKKNHFASQCSAKKKHTKSKKMKRANKNSFIV